MNESTPNGARAAAPATSAFRVAPETRDAGGPAAAERQLPSQIDNYRSEKGAKSYSTKYDRVAHKRLSMKAERCVLEKAFAAMGKHETLLDMPSGPGRLYPFIAPHARSTVECDISAEMLKLLRAVAQEEQRRPGLVVASCFDLPFPDRSFDGVVSIRLNHHIIDQKDRERHLAEVLRVCRRNCLFTFFDHDSLKNRLRRLRRLLGSRKRSKYAMPVASVRATAARCGFEWVQSWSISRFFSGHRFVWLRRVQPDATPAGARA